MGLLSDILMKLSNLQIWDQAQNLEKRQGRVNQLMKSVTAPPGADWQVSTQTRKDMETDYNLLLILIFSKISWKFREK